MNEATHRADAAIRGEGSLDMRLPNPVPPKVLQQLRLGVDKSLQGLLQTLPGYLQVDVNGGVEAVSQLAFSDLAGSMDPASYLLSFPLPRTPAKAIVEFSSIFLGTALEVLLGAVPVAPPDPRGPLTEIETHILRELLQLIVGCLASGWPAGSGLAPVELDIVDPAELEAEETSQVATVFTIGLTLADVPGTIRIAFPSLAVRLLALLPDAAADATTPPSGRERMAEILESASLLLEVVLPKSTICMRDLMELRKGQVLTLAHNPHAKVDCTVNGATKFRGQIVAANSRIGRQIDELVGASVSPR
ncbi:MAG: FliM/FliN family flagellar motor switch protein [Bryobacteraceae bacterium]